MHLIGLTGNIATGKSTVMDILRQHGAVTLDADAVVHELLDAGTPVTRAIAGAFGQDVLDTHGAVDRAKLANIVFNDPDALKRLETIVHPAVGERIVNEVEYWRSRPDAPPAFVIEAIKLVETGRHAMCDTLWLVTADNDVQRRRLIEQRDMTAEDAEARLSAQPPLDEKRRLADVIIENNGTREDLRRQVDVAWRTYIEPESQEQLHA